MKNYVNCWAAKPWGNLNYIEMYESEYNFLKNPKNLCKHLKDCKMVEIGLNEFGKVCKVSYIVYLDQVCPQLYLKSESRCLFFCVGVDGFIKTINITPGNEMI